jgi:hypothetical protein
MLVTTPDSRVAQPKRDFNAEINALAGKYASSGANNNPEYQREYQAILAAERAAGGGGGTGAVKGTAPPLVTTPTGAGGGGAGGGPLGPPPVVPPTSPVTPPSMAGMEAAMSGGLPESGNGVSIQAPGMIKQLGRRVTPPTPSIQGMQRLY